MSSPQSLTLYTAKVCPYAHRRPMPRFKVYKIDLANKPEWYAPKVNPASKVPAIAYGGPDVLPEDPSPESTKLAESLVLVEFVADLYPQANLLPGDPVLRAQARFFIEVAGSKFGSSYMKFIRAVQISCQDSGKYAIGDQYTIADVAFTPFFARFKSVAESEIGKYEIGQGHALLKTLESPKYAKFNTYVGHLLERPSFVATFDEDHVKDVFEKRFGRTQ
ncbi:glutathione S-transferase C-terminal-like protein [Melanogaster broomeanus]|nr:glutathione S-transferase C-terminal-like protein [Melanogaster broomeanus]